MGRTLAGSISALLVLVILTATLLPSPPQGGELASRRICFLCGDRALADAVCNILLFLPLGASLAVALGARARTVLLMVALSAGIEVVQTLVPGRYPSPSDVMFNTCGGWMGVVLTSWVPRLSIPGPRALGWLRAASLAWAVTVVVATGFLNRPSLPGSRYHVGRASELGAFEHYRGRVGEVLLDGVPAGPGTMDGADGMVAALERGAMLQVGFDVGPRPLGFAPLWGVYDEESRMVALLGVYRSDLVLRVRRRADDLRLDKMDIRLPGALDRLEPGDAAVAQAWRDERGTPCLSLNGSSGCGLGLTAGSGWALLYFSERMPPWLVSLLGPLWLALLFAPTGFFGGSVTTPRRPTWWPLLALSVLAALSWVSTAIGLADTPLLEAGGVAAGLITGAALRRVVVRRTAVPGVSSASGAGREA